MSKICPTPSILRRNLLTKASAVTHDLFVAQNLPSGTGQILIHVNKFRMMSVEVNGSEILNNRQGQDGECQT